MPVRFATCAWVNPASYRSRDSCSPIANLCDSSSNPLRNFGLASFLSSHPSFDLAVLAFMFHSPFKILLAGFGSVNFTPRRFVTRLPESMREDQPSSDEKETQGPRIGVSN